MNIKRPLFLFALATFAACPAHAQLVSDEVRGDQRLCTYFGSVSLPNDTLSARTLTIGLGQNCPAVAPYSDPDQRPPSNAALRGESTNSTNRFCIYEQGGINYELTIPVAFNCAMTPALLDRVLNPQP